MSEPPHTLDLPALDGANPLGFLAAIGTLTVLSETDPTLKLGWHARARWVPFLSSTNPLDESSMLEQLASRLRGQPVVEEAEKKRAASQKRFDLAKKRLKDAKERLAALKLKGNQLKSKREQFVSPFQKKLDYRREIVLARLRKAVPSPELALGQRPDCTIEEFRENARSMRVEATSAARDTVDMLASFGVEMSGDPNERIAPTPFCFITGSGHQWFLDTARKLMSHASESKLREALFQPWTYADEKLTMRWDPLDDRRYALMDRDPTADDNKSTTVWMANLLAYIALANFPCVATECGPATGGWLRTKESITFTWPVWRRPLTRDAIRSLLALRAFAAPSDEAERTQSREDLRSRGVEAVYSARRIQVGNPPLHKVNFSPPTAR